MRLSPPGTHFTAKSTEAMRIKCHAQGHNILMSGIEQSTSVSQNRNFKPLDQYAINVSNNMQTHKLGIDNQKLYSLSHVELVCCSTAHGGVRYIMGPTDIGVLHIVWLGTCWGPVHGGSDTHRVSAHCVAWNMVGSGTLCGPVHDGVRHIMEYDIRLGMALEGVRLIVG